MTDAWPAYLAQPVSEHFAGLPPHVQEMTRDVLDIASRDPWSWPLYDPTDPEGEDVRRADVGALTVVYWVNRAFRRLNVLNITWLG